MRPPDQSWCCLQPPRFHLPRLEPANWTVRRQPVGLVCRTKQGMRPSPVAASKSTAHEYRSSWCRLNNTYGAPHHERPRGGPAPALDRRFGGRGGAAFGDLCITVIPAKAGIQGGAPGWRGLLHPPNRALHGELRKGLRERESTGGGAARGIPPQSRRASGPRGVTQRSPFAGMTVSCDVFNSMCAQ